MTGPGFEGLGFEGLVLECLVLEGQGFEGLGFDPGQGHQASVPVAHRRAAVPPASQPPPTALSRPLPVR